MINFKCMYCGEELEAPISLGGEKIDCPSCQHSVVIPRSKKPSVSKKRSGSASNSTCPGCSEKIPHGASKCPFCGKSLNLPHHAFESDLIPKQRPEEKITFTCSKCGKEIHAEKALAGKVVQCTHCHLHEIVPKR